MKKKLLIPLVSFSIIMTFIGCGAKQEAATPEPEAGLKEATEETAKEDSSDTSIDSDSSYIESIGGKLITGYNEPFCRYSKDFYYFYNPDDNSRDYSPAGYSFNDTNEDFYTQTSISHITYEDSDPGFVDVTVDGGTYAYVTILGDSAAELEEKGYFAMIELPVLYLSNKYTGEIYTFPTQIDENGNFTGEGEADIEYDNNTYHISYTYNGSSTFGVLQDWTDYEGTTQIQMIDRHFKHTYTIHMPSDCDVLCISDTNALTEVDKVEAGDFVMDIKAAYENYYKDKN
ncbi:MAG: hypothetical protein MJ110_01150 [Lachnospiraceae bacterium]|nr:hypothetical protein [Lachnospiraceae bacterium]